MRLALSTPRHVKTRTLKYFVCFALLAICIWLSARKVNLSGWPVNDYSAYWAASRLLVAGQNPYDHDSVLALQKTVGAQHPEPLVMRNPPWTLPLILPLALLTFSVGRILWLSFGIVFLIAGAMWLWKNSGGRESQRWVAWLVVLSFMPGLWVLAMGQITPFILVGIIGFLYCELNDRSNTWLQAASLGLVALKPQLLYLFWLALFLQLVWNSQQKKIASAAQTNWSLPLKLVVLLLAMTALPTLIDSQVCAQYLEYLRQTPILLEPIPTIGNLLRMYTHIGWTQFAPMFVGAGWLLWRWSRQRSNWNWSEEIPLLLLASLLTTPYCWFYDQVVLLPAILFALAQTTFSSNRAKIILALALYLAVDAGVFAIHYFAGQFTDVLFVWMTPAWCFLYIALRWLTRGRNPEKYQPGSDNITGSLERVNYASDLTSQSSAAGIAMLVRSPAFTENRIRSVKYMACIAVIGAAGWFCAHKVNQSNPTVSDYAAYSSASRLLITGQNPYDPEKVFALEKAIGWVPMPLVIRNPPWALAFVLPCGLVAYKWSRILWAVPETLIIIACASWMWRQYSHSLSSRWVAWLLACTFFPLFRVMVMGQITPFILLGVVGFLYCECNNRANSWLQAFCLVLIALKPQLLYLFWLPLGLSAFWALRRLDVTSKELRRWSLFLRFGCLLLALSAIALLFDPHIFTEYFTYLRNTPILLEVIPTLGIFLRIQTHLLWTQFAPMFVGCGWVLWRWAKRRDNWNWAEEMPILLLASLLTTTYSWFYDQVVLLPALLYAAGLNFPSRNRIHAALVVVLYLAVNAGVMVLFVHGLTNFRLLWAMPAWCILFSALCLLGRKLKRMPTTTDNCAETAQPVGYASNLAA